VRDLGERIRLVHELRQLRRTEELANRGRHRLGVHKISRHRREHVLLDRHLFLDRTFHALEADAELIFKQLTDGTNTAITKMIDVVLDVMLAVLLHAKKVVHHLDEIARRKKRIVDAIALRTSHLDVELQTADA
jgi:hypothetical protein